MSILALIVLALGLSMDSFAVSLSSGVALKPFKIAHVIKIALYLSFFQAVMPILGWLLGVGFVNIIQSVDHWIAFALLLFLGGKMIFDVISNKVWFLVSKKEALKIAAHPHTVIGKWSVGSGFKEGTPTSLQKYDISVIINVKLNTNLIFSSQLDFIKKSLYR